jgi:hypothetical protein
MIEHHIETDWPTNDGRDLIFVITIISLTAMGQVACQIDTLIYIVNIMKKRNSSCQ